MLKLSEDDHTKRVSTFESDEHLRGNDAESGEGLMSLRLDAIGDLHSPTEGSSVMVRVDPQRILKGGLAIGVTIEAVPEAGTSKVAPIRVGAIIDTGECSGISEKVATAFTDAASGTRQIWTPTLGLRTEPTLRCKLTYDDDAKTNVTTDFSLIRELEPHDVAIGRDLLMNSKLFVDFRKGEWSLAPSESSSEPT